jgi:hypothetical protein
MNTPVKFDPSSLQPPPLLPLWNRRVPADIVAMRAAELPGMVALPVRSLIPSLPAPIWVEDPALGPTDLNVVREATRAKIQRMDWSKIQRGKVVNLLANPHGFYLMGEAYVAMLEEIAAHIKAACHARVRLCIAESMGHIENPNWVKVFDLENRFDKVKEVPQIAEGVKADTRLGPFWLLKDLFKGDYFVHTLVSEMREGYIHRMIDRAYKPFGMAYTRVETRSAYHMGYGPRTGQMVSRAVFESDFIQQRYVGTVALDTSPEGVIGVEADNDLGILNRTLTERVLRNYGTLVRLMSEIKDCICVFDGHGSGVYCYAGGIAFDNLFSANTDFLDIDNLGFFTRDSGALAGMDIREGLLMGFNKSIKYLVMNYMAGGVPQSFLFKAYPTVIVGEELFKWHCNDPSSATMRDHASLSPDLNTAMKMVYEKTGTDKVLIYDRTPGVLRVSESLAKVLIERAPEVIRDVETNRLPKWLAQRNLA